MVKQRISEAQNHIIYILGRYHEMKSYSELIKKGVFPLVFRQKTVGSVEKINMRVLDDDLRAFLKDKLPEFKEHASKIPFNPVSLVKIKEILLLSLPYKSKDSSKVAVFNSARILEMRGLLKQVIVNSQTEVCLTSKGFRLYLSLIKKVQPYIDLQYNFESTERRLLN